MTERNQIKGVHLVNVFKFIKWKRGILGTQRFLEAWHSDPKHKKITPETFVEKDWYDYDLYLEMLNVADKVVGLGDLSKIYELGYWNIKNLGHLSYLASKPDINDFINNAQKNWNQVYTFGGVEIIENSPRKIVMRYKGFPKSPEKCHYFKGSLTGMMEICHLEGKVEETACNAKGADYCEFTLSW